MPKGFFKNCFQLHHNSMLCIVKKWEGTVFATYFFYFFFFWSAQKKQNVCLYWENWAPTCSYILYHQHNLTIPTKWQIRIKKTCRTSLWNSTSVRRIEKCKNCSHKYFTPCLVYNYCVVLSIPLLDTIIVYQYICQCVFKTVTRF